MKQIFRPVVWIAAIVFLIFETIWDWSEKQLSRLDVFKSVRLIEDMIRVLSPYLSLVIFVIPDLLMIPAMDKAMAYIAGGQMVTGIVIIIVVKIIGIALFARIFNLTRDSLMTLGWFSKLYGVVMTYRNKIHAYLENWKAYQDVKSNMKLYIDVVKTLFAGVIR